MTHPVITAMRAACRDDLDPTDDELRDLLRVALEAAGYAPEAYERRPISLPGIITDQLRRAAYGDDTAPTEG